MKQFWETIKGFFTRDWSPAEKILIVVCCTLLGMVKGFLLSPVKRGIFCDNKKNVYNQLDDGYWLDDED